MCPAASEPEERRDAGRIGAALAAFRVPHFPTLWLSNLLQLSAGQVQLLTLQWLVTSLTPSRTLLGLVGFIQGSTVALSSPAAGVAVDRFAKRELLLWGRVGLSAVVLGLAALVRSGRVEIWHILVASLAAGLLNALMQPATQTFVFDVVGRRRVQNAVALNAAGTGIAQIAGPAATGILIAIVGVVGSFVSAAAGLVLAAALLLWIPIAGGPAEGRSTSAWRDLRDGFAHVRANPPVLLALVVCTMALFNGALFAMRPIFARHVLDVGSAGYGAMAGFAGLGVVAGSVLSAALPPARRPGVWIALSMLGFSLCIFFYAFAFSYPYILAVEFASGVFGQLWNVSTFSGLQMAVPESLRGRVVSLVFTVVQLAFIGQLFVGALADAVGDQLAMGIFGAIPSLVVTGILIFGRRTLRAL